MSRQTRPSPNLRLRPGMDVYSTYQDHYIGSVVAVGGQGPGPRPLTEPGRRIRAPGPARPAAGGPPSGEEMGPFPTLGVGNTGPINQSASHEYGTAPGGGQGVVWFTVRLGRLNPFARVVCIPTSAIRSVSMERIIVNL